MKSKTKWFLWLTPLSIATTYTVAVVGLRSEPSGYVASYSIFDHSITDVLDFSGGTVTLRTCCGNESWGTYSRSSDGAWIWHRRHESPTLVSQELVVRPGFFSIHFAETQNPSSHFTLRRRAFTAFPL